MSTRRRIALFLFLVLAASNAEAGSAPAAPGYQPATRPIPPSDPSGFLGWLNATRASYGLSPVAYDPAMYSVCAANNQYQQSRGLGHYVMSPARRQNSAWSPSGYGAVPGMWLSSPPHRAALLDPSIRLAAIAAAGAYWTFSAR